MGFGAAQDRQPCAHRVGIRRRIAVEDEREGVSALQGLTPLAI